MFILYLKLLRSKDLCHHILNNEEMYYITNKLLNINKKNNSNFIFEYINGFKYAWTRFYMDERAKEGMLNTDDEIVFNINTACKLPFFAPLSNEYYTSPYIAIPIGRNNFKNNILGVGINYTSSANYPLGIENLDTFKENMNIFISGSNIFNIFEGISF